MIRVRRYPVMDSPDFPLAPMVDIVFLLLFFFLVTGSIEGRRNHLPINLPTARPAEPVRTEPREVRIEIDALGRILLQGNEVSLASASGYLAKYDPDLVVIAADRNASHGAVIGVLAEAKAAGVENYAFEVLAGR